MEKRKKVKGTYNIHVIGILQREDRQNRTE